MRKIILILMLLESLNCMKKEEETKINSPNYSLKGSFPKTVLFTYEYQYAKYISEKYLKNIELINEFNGLLGVQGYIGYYKGIKVLVITSGIEMPSMNILSNELFNVYNVENIIKLGPLASIQNDINLNDIIIATSASTNSDYGKNFNLDGVISGAASYKLIKKVDEVIEKIGLSTKSKFGHILSIDSFKPEEIEDYLKWGKIGVFGIEIKGYELYLNAAREGKNAIVISTVNEQLITKKYLNEEEKKSALDDIFKIALETAFCLEVSSLKNKNNYLLVAIDLDGTLLTSDKKVLPETIKDINEASEKGIHIVYSTGRGPAEMQEILDILPSIRYGICMSGALVYDFKEHKTIYINSIPRDIVNIIIEAVKFDDPMIHLLTESESIVREDQINHMKDFNMEVYQPMYKKFARTVKNMKEEINKYEGIPKINIYFRSKKARQEAYDKLKNLNIDFSLAENTSLEMNAKDINKGKGLSILASYLGVSISQIIGIGDGNNDYSFLKIVGLPIAMKNANENIKNISKYITDDNNSNGVGKAIRKFCL